MQNLFCIKHPELKITYFCSEKDCPYLYLCSNCILDNLEHAQLHK